MAGEDDHKFKIVWANVALTIYLHIAAFYGLKASKTGGTHLLQMIMAIFGAFGITVSAHQLFSHQSFKANKKLKALLVFLHTTTCMYSLHDWTRVHRVHHKYNDTNADPHNSARGFFYSHVGWLLVEKHPDFKKFGERIDLRDIVADKLVMFQHKYFLILGLLTGFALPVSISWVFFGDSFMSAFNYNCSRHLLVLHSLAMINSVAHTWGYRPFDK